MRAAVSACICAAILLAANIAGDGRATAMGGLSDRQSMHFTTWLGSACAPSWSPDGKHLAFVVGDYPDDMAIVTVNLPRQTARVLCRGTSPHWSPKGDLIALIDRRPRSSPALYVVPAKGGSRPKLISDHVDGEPVWSPDGRFLAFEQRTKLTPPSRATSRDRVSCGDVYLAQVASGAVRRLTHFAAAFPEGARDLKATPTSWLGNATLMILVRVRFESATERSPLSGVYTLDTDTGQTIRLFPGEFGEALLSPDGKEVLLTDYSRKTLPNGEWQWQVGLLLGRIGDQRTQEVAPPHDDLWFSTLSVSWPRRTLVGAGEGAERSRVLRSVALDGGARHLLTPPEATSEGAPAVSPDGAKVAFYRQVQGWNSELYLRRIDGADAHSVLDTVQVGLSEELKARLQKRESYLHSSGEDEPTPSFDRATAGPIVSLHRAAAAGDLAELRSLLSQGADLHATDRYGKTPLHAAAAAGHLAAAELLLAASARINAADWYGETPLHLAVRGGHTDTASLLIEKGADANAKLELGGTALHLAAWGGHAAAAQLLINRGAEITAADEGGKTPLHLAAQAGHLTAAQLLVNSGAEVSAADEHGDTPLHLAANGTHTAIARLLIENGADVKPEGYFGRTPLHAAAEAGATDIAKLVIERGAAVSKADSYGSTPLHLAAREGHLDTARLLVERGAEINAVDDTDDMPLHVAALRGRADIVQLLVQAGADVKARGELGETPLSLAVSEHQIPVVRLLIDLGFDVNARDESGHTPLHVAVSAGHADIAKILIEAGAQVNARGCYDKTPLAIALSYNHQDLVKLLRQHGATE